MSIGIVPVFLNRSVTVFPVAGVIPLKVTVACAFSAFVTLTLPLSSLEV